MQALIRFIHLFFTILHFLFSKEDTSIHTGAHQISAYKTEKTQLVKFANLNQYQAVIKSAATSENEDFFVEDEDENESTVFARKHLLQTNYFLIFSFTFVLGFLYSRFKYRLPFCIHLTYTCSCKYLTQRALRI
ncbi:MAG: hypothetical protein ACRYFT_08880 [Janthinobacterium lividum]